MGARVFGAKTREGRGVLRTRRLERIPNEIVWIWGRSRVRVGHGVEERKKREKERKREREASSGVLGWYWAGSGGYGLFSLFFDKTKSFFLFSVFKTENKIKAKHFIKICKNTFQRASII